MDVVCALLEERGSFLVCRRPFSKDSGGLWEFPGGKVQQGESLSQAIERELEEELGIKVSAGRVLNPVVIDKGETKLKLIPIFVKLESGHIQLNEHIGIKWLEPEQMSSLPMCEGDVIIAQSLQLIRQK